MNEHKKRLIQLINSMTDEEKTAMARNVLLHVPVTNAKFGAGRGLLDNTTDFIKEVDLLDGRIRVGAKLPPIIVPTTTTTNSPRSNIQKGGGTTTTGVLRSVNVRAASTSNVMSQPRHSLSVGRFKKRASAA